MTKDERITLRISADLRKKLEKDDSSTGITLSKFIIYSIERYYANLARQTRN